MFHKIETHAPKLWVLLVFFEFTISLRGLLNTSASRYLHPPSPSLTKGSLRPWGHNHSSVGAWKIDNLIVTVFARVFDLVRLAFRRPRFYGEAFRALEGARFTHWSLAVVTPEKKRRGDFS